MVSAMGGWGVQRGRGGIKGPAKECGEQRKRREERNDIGEIRITVDTEAEGNGGHRGRRVVI